MASIQPRGSKWQLRVVHKLLPKTFFQTFDDETKARNYGEQLESLLAAGVVPQNLFANPDVVKATPPLHEVITSYLLRASPAKSSVDTLELVKDEIGSTKVGDVSFAWAEGYVADLKKREKKPTPGTIRKRVGALARVLDWHYRDTHEKGETLPVNVLRMLPEGYSLYEDGARVDTSRDHRFEADHEARILAALDGQKRDDRERPLQPDPAFRLFFETIVDTGLRLREAYWLRVEQLDGARGLLQVDGTKGHRGALKKRTVPLKREIREKLIAWCKDKKPKELIFPFWHGTEEDLPRCSSRLSHRFMVLFDYAGVPHFTEHDLRHEACCRWVMLRGKDGGWLFNEIEICKIMGWTDTKMMLRYASLRGEDLAGRLL